MGLNVLKGLVGALVGPVWTFEDILLCVAVTHLAVAPVVGVQLQVCCSLCSPLNSSIRHNERCLYASAVFGSNFPHWGLLTPVAASHAPRTCLKTVPWRVLIFPGCCLPCALQPCGGAIPLCMVQEFDLPMEIIDRKVGFYLRYLRIFQYFPP